MPSNLALLLMELTQMPQIYSGTFTIFVDHGLGHLRITINYGKTKGAVSICVERLSGDLEFSREIIELDRADILPMLCHIFKVSEQSLLHIRQTENDDKSQHRV